MRFQIMSIFPRWLAPAALALGLIACGSGGMSGQTMGTQGCTPASCGNALVTMTDAAGDFASYTVDVTSLQLTKADGTVVETLPVKTRVDFTQLVNVTEFVASAAIPQGEYVSATMTLDYSNAAIFVYTDAADTPPPTQVAKVLDTAGNTIYLQSASPPVTPSTVTVAVQLDNKNHLFINPGKLARLALDFNVAASNTVDLSVPTAPVVQVSPFIVASAVPTDTKEIRVRGALASVDVGGESYTVTVEPFDDEDRDRGQVVVHTTTQTAFEVDGTSYMGDAGLTALSGDPAGTMTVAFGTLSTTDHTFTASRVLAGTSVESMLDRLQGVVIARSGDTLIVRGGSLWQHTDDEDHFSARDVTLTIASTTVITVAGEVMDQANPVSPLALPSVGSRITAFGKAGKDASGNPTFDATNGRLRLELTTLWGTASQIGSNSVTLNLQAIEGRSPSVFNFAGTGTTSAQDSNPQSYIVTTGALPLTTLSASAPLRFFGLVQPFGSAPPDFNARTLVDFTDTSALLEASYGAGSTMALTASSADLVLNVKDPMLGWEHFIRVGPQRIDLKSLLTDVTILPLPGGTGPFAIHFEAPPGMGQPDTLNVYNSFADFETALAAKLTGGAKVLNVFAVGHYDATTNTFTAAQIALTIG